MFALMMLKTSLSFANLVPAPTGSGCESLEIFQPFIPSSSVLAAAASWYFWLSYNIQVFLSSFFGCKLLHHLASLLSGLSSLLLPKRGHFPC